eukprot:9152746-Pyramimonas_sp.AAC.1
MGVFNRSVDFLGDAGILGPLGATTIVPESIQFTCSVGETMIDCVVCSDLLLPYLEVSADFRSPFKTRACLGVTLNPEATVQPLCQRVEPLEILEAH